MEKSETRNPGPVTKKHKFEYLLVRCPRCGCDFFYRFDECKDRNWMCGNEDCYYVLTSTEESHAESEEVEIR